MAASISWRKSSFSEGPESACVEAGGRKDSLGEVGASAHAEVGWRKSSFSEGPESDCVEVGFAETRAAIRDSKNPTGPTLSLPLPAWHHLLATTRPRPMP